MKRIHAVPKPKIEAVRRCRVCSCTEQRACRSGCAWAEADLCTVCVHLRDIFRDYLETAYRPTVGRVQKLFREVLP